jgi:hypothetical protein
MTAARQHPNPPTVALSGDGEVLPCPIVMTEGELIRFLRIPEISTAGNH